MKIWQNVYEGLNISYVKFYHDLYAGLKKYPENLKISAITGRLPVPILDPDLQFLVQGKTMT